MTINTVSENQPKEKNPPQTSKGYNKSSNEYI